MLSNSGYTVALNAVQYSQSWCGKTITISANGKTHSATIQDECPGDGTTCKWGALDMSPALFNYFSDPSAGVIDITWSVGGGGGGGILGGLLGGGSSSSSSNDDDDDNSKSSSSSSSSNNNNNNDDDAQASKSAAAASASRAAASAAAASKAAEAKADAQAAASSASAAAAASRVSAAAYASSTSAAAVESASRASVKSGESGAYHDSLTSPIDHPYPTLPPAQSNTQPSSLPPRAAPRPHQWRVSPAPRQPRSLRSTTSTTWPPSRARPFQRLR